MMHNFMIVQLRFMEQVARIEAHVLGDAYPPRRLVFATRQAYALARELAA